MNAEIKVVPENSGLPERRFIPSGVPDFIGDPDTPVQEFTDDRVYRVICSVCGLIDKAPTPTEGETRGDAHLRKHHRRPRRCPCGLDPDWTAPEQHTAGCSREAV